MRAKVAIFFISAVVLSVIKLSVFFNPSLLCSLRRRIDKFTETEMTMTASLHFLTRFTSIFLILYGFNLGFIGITSPGGVYIPFFDEHCNYIIIWRKGYLYTAAKILEWADYKVLRTETTLKVQGYAGFKLVYSCLGYGIMSCVSAFIMAFPKPLRSRLQFMAVSMIVILLLNLCRFILIPLTYSPENTLFASNHHDIFNATLYFILLLMMYKWVNS